MSRVVLHPLAEDRRQDFLAATRKSKRLHRPWVDPPTTDEGFDGWLERQASDSFEGFMIYRREDDALVGLCQLSEIVRGNLQGAFLGFGAIAGYSGQGYMREGLTLVLGEAFSKLKLHRVEANIQPANAASIGLVSRLGFEREGFSRRYLKVAGRWRDHERWAMRAERWRELRRR
jgi:ribosomal-protein-alanine N-acetyltransferase